MIKNCIHYTQWKQNGVETSLKTFDDPCVTQAVPANMVLTITLRPCDFGPHAHRSWLKFFACENILAWDHQYYASKSMKIKITIFVILLVMYSSETEQNIEQL